MIYVWTLSLVKIVSFSFTKGDMKSVSRSIGLAFTFNPYILQCVLGQITPVSLTYYISSLHLIRFIYTVPAFLNPSDYSSNMKQRTGKLGTEKVIHLQLCCKVPRYL